MQVIIIGGGCFGTFYTRQLLTARSEGKIAFESLNIIDKNKDCQMTREIQDPEAQVSAMDWKAYLRGYAAQYFDQPDLKFREDIFIPSHWAPHLLWDMLIVHIQQETTLPDIEVKKIKVTDKIQTPYEMILENGDDAVSFATWACPPHCIEPKKCPHTKEDRDWEMGDSLKQFFQDRGEDYYSFFCRHLANGVAGIPMSDIHDEYLRLKAAVKKNKLLRVAIATHSSCHGLLSLVEISHA
jgi:hypothetical protein